MDVSRLLHKDPRDLASMAGLLGVPLPATEHPPALITPILEVLGSSGRVGSFAARGIVESVGHRQRSDFDGFHQDRDAARRRDNGRLWVNLDGEGEPLEVVIPRGVLERCDLRVGDEVEARLHLPERGRALAVRAIDRVNGRPIGAVVRRRMFERLRTTFPTRRMTLERANAGRMASVGRMVDIVAPIGFGQRALVVAPPRTGKTMLLSEIAKSVQANYPAAELMVLLIDERPEEVAFMRDALDCPVYASTFDLPPQRHVRLAELVIERAKRLVEHGRDVVVVLDSLTRLARAYNAVQPNSGRILTGGVDAASLDKPKRIFGAARNFAEGGSLTIVATALVDTGSRADQVHYEELKGTGSAEIVLDRRLAERGVYPAIDVLSSGTRMDEELYTSEEKRLIDMLRAFVKTKHAAQATEWLVENFRKTKSNVELIRWVHEREASARQTQTVSVPQRDRGPDRISDSEAQNRDSRRIPGGPAGYVRGRI